MINFLEPFEYHKKVRDYFKKQTKTWDWFSSIEAKKDHFEKLRTELLKNTYALKPEQVPYYSWAEEIKKKIALDIEVHFYQEMNSTDLNMSVSIINKEAHIVFSGPIQHFLKEPELKSIIAHELFHVLFNQTDNGELEIAERIITGIANDVHSDDCWIETARIFQLYLELYCDRGALFIMEDPKIVIEALVKTSTGLTTVTAESYLDQAKEILKIDEQSKSNQYSHPETYIRTLALDYSKETPEEATKKIEKLIISNLDVSKLDIFQQRQMRDITKEIIQLMLKPRWMRSDTTLSLARQYFSDYKNNRGLMIDEPLRKKFEKLPLASREYLSYVLLDFVVVDKDLEEVPLGQALEVSEQLGFSKKFDQIARKEYKMISKEFNKLKERAVNAMNDMFANQEEELT